ncbi:hypothetical protein SUGI_0223600 [Cryptomeria japonica]|uniref:G-type lectin S-receptor-like serine/threonine-protein kinase At2g19130 n=1 Tax=Cryptomeria japonica TaxID=3369 RepID=UPI002408A279|nr:G-type lectin S-receptor-like serine/threonine-protein kinase At2g19130 [Cryptomeria japonica]GLJ13986.1 hypothetical protein SUGI_0223600 [Cryptomeria japonica]
MNGILRTDYHANFSIDSVWPNWVSFSDQCDVYNVCGVYGKCDQWSGCSCLEGFGPRNSQIWHMQEWWSSGCVRESPLNCSSQNGSTDGFIEYLVSLPDNPAYSYPARTRKICETECLRNCSCTAFSYTARAGPCQIWSGDLHTLRSTSSGPALFFVRVANGSRFEPDPFFSSRRKVVSVSLLSVFVIALLITYLLRRMRRRSSSTAGCDDSSTTSLRMFTYTELKIATGNFKNKLGSGGFGSVFKGILTDTTLVAVKKLEGSRIAEKQFRAEINSVGNIHHVNLIRLRGFCAQGSHRLLVYDCMPNGSLNSFLFNRNSESQGKTLDWKSRFGIALGIARALHYLHEECRDRIIHGDIKPENILLDADYSPKLGDFGLAKLLGRDFSHVLTTTRGTRGYLAPEWISGLPITPKVDVYSFGMTLLEIISGRRNLDLSVQESSRYYFPAWAATEIQQGSMMNIVDKRIVNNACVEEVRRATLVSLLCIQNDENARPSMGQVVHMLEGITEAHEVALQMPSHMEDHEIEAGSTDSD